MLYSINKYSKLSHESLNLYVSDYDIYAYYLNSNFTIGQIFNSPFRKDKNPSFGIYDLGNGKLLFKDFSKGIDGNAITFVQYMNNLSTFREALVTIYLDLVINNKKASLDSLEVTKYIKRNSIDIGIKAQPFSEEDLKWWASFGINEATLIKFEVTAAKYMFVGPYIKHEYSKKEPMYAYYVYDELKIYRPLSDKSQKWYGSLRKNYIHGYKQLPDKGDLLVITKSLKDVMCLDTLGYNAISPSSEGTLIPKQIINILKARFKTIIIFYDNDEPGLNYAKRMCDKYQLKNTIIPLCEEAKDISDFLKKYSKEQAKVYLKHMFGEDLISGNNNPDEKNKTKKT